MKDIIMEKLNEFENALQDFRDDFNIELLGVIRQAKKDRRMLLIQTERADIMAQYADKKIPQKQFARLMVLRDEVNE